MLELTAVPLKTQFSKLNIIFRMEIQCKLGEFITFVGIIRKQYHVKVKINVPPPGARSRSRGTERSLRLNPSQQDSHVYIQNNDITNVLVSMKKINKSILIPHRKQKE